MKLAILSLVLAAVVATHAVRLGGADDLSAKPGECASGLPRDGRFAKCALGDWKVGATRLFKAVNASDILFSSDFIKGWKEDFSNDSLSSCSASIPGNAVLYQRLTDDILYAHYRLRACARVLGNTPCSVVVKTARNEIYDKLEFLPDTADLGSCTAPKRGPISRDCISSCSTSIESITLRYEGLLPAKISARSSQLGVDDFQFVNEFVRGDEYSVNLTKLSEFFNMSIDAIPDVELLTVYGNNETVIDAISFNCSTLSAYPGQRLGDQRQFLVVSMSASEGDFCSWSDLANRHNECSCDNSASAREVCMFSDKGFVADPAEQFYIGLESESCGCSFDNICLEQLNGPEGYFGLDWILHEESKDSNNTDDSSNSA